MSEILYVMKVHFALLPNGTRSFTGTVGELKVRFYGMSAMVHCGTQSRGPSSLYYHQLAILPLSCTCQVHVKDTAVSTSPCDVFDCLLGEPVAH